MTNHTRMSLILYLAAAYNIAWGVIVVARPLLAFRLAGMPLPNYPQLWQCIGMIIGTYGIGYAIAARDPIRHWPIVFVGFLGKILGPIGFFMAVKNGEIPLIASWTIVTNDLIWWIPFTWLLAQVFKSVKKNQS